MREFWIIGFIIFLPFLVSAQEENGEVMSMTPTIINDSIAVPLQTENSLANSSIFMTPKKTALYSALIPGLGQVYNKEYWKVPVIYALMGVAVYFINDNLKNYNEFRRIYAGRISNNPESFLEYPEYSLETVRQARNFYRSNLDLTILLTAAGYTIQVLDAVIFAHLKDFDISDDISLRMKPVSNPQGGLGFGLVMSF